VLEEAPAPGMTDERRRAMGEAACAAARAVGYAGAGTVEFIVDTASDAFYFMEMNTRLQVEHPVTEYITGQDLVEWQLKVAFGQALPLTQAQLTLSGHAIEARVYAEDPDNDFLPATGRLVHLSAPEESATVRVDTGVAEGDTITPFYDPMIAKLIVWGKDRATALARLDAALADYQVAGLVTHLPFLQADELLPPPAAPSAEQLALIALADTLAEQPAGDAAWSTLPGWRLNARQRRRRDYRHGDTDYAVEVEYAGDALTLCVGEACFTARGRLDDTELSANLNGRRLNADLVRHGKQRTLFCQGERLTVEWQDPLAVEAGGAHGEAHLRAPMPGRVVAWLAEPGATVSKGTPLMILEAMKMEHTLAAPSDGKVAAFYYAPGEQVDDGADLVDFEAA